MTKLRPLNADRPFRFAAIGECMVEMAPAEGAGLFKQGFAGDTFNTVWYLRQLCPDWQTPFVTKVGSDSVSADLITMMQGAGIDTDHVGVSQDRTMGLYLISLKDGERSFSYWRDMSAAKQLAADAAALGAALAGADLVYASGITLAILDDSGRETLMTRLIILGIPRRR